MADAWGDAPPLVTCPPACITDSEKSFVLRRLHSFPIRKDHESRSKQRGLKRSPSASPFFRAKHAPTLIQRDSHSSFHETAYFSSCPPSAPLALMVLRDSDEVIDIVNDSTSTTSIIKTAPHYADIRSLVGEIADTAVTKSDTIIEGNHSENCSMNVTCSSPESRSSPPMRKRFRRHSIAVTRNKAVQAISTPLERDCRNVNHETEFEWVGGVRALRDSHVRHVLRQLKHISRLNRALDRVHHSETD